MAAGAPILPVRIAFYAFVFSIPFERIAGLDWLQYATLSTLLGYLFALSMLLQPRACFRRPPAALWFFLIYLLAYITIGSCQDIQYQQAVSDRFFTLVQMFVLLWTVSNLLRHESVAKGFLLVLASSCALLALLQLLGVTSSDMASAPHARFERVTAFDDNPNGLAAVLTIGLLALVGLAYGRSKVLPSIRPVAWPLLACMALVIIETGSRGGSLDLACGLLCFGLSGASGVRTHVRNIFLMLVMIAALAWLTQHSATARWRWQQTLDNPLSRGSLSFREHIFPAAWNMFLEKPLAGWGPGHFLYELAARLGEQGRKSPHNLVLWILDEVGLVGAVPFFMGTWLCVRAAWRARRGTEGIVPLAMTAAVVMVNMSGTWHYYKLQWLVFAYALASGTSLVSGRRRLADSAGPASPRAADLVRSRS